MAANGQGFAERALRLGQVALTAPLYSLLGQNDRTLANRIAHLAYRNMSEDRITILGQEYFDEVLKDKILDSGLDLIKRASAEGHVIVLMSEGLEHIMKPLAGNIAGVDHLICNRLEFRNGEATGKLLDPVIGGHDGGRWVREFADEHNINLAQSVAYAAHGADMLLLAAVGSPCAVNPDFTLRRAAKEADWPVMEYQF
jgi:phosphoserine phosphatase